jgi:hypothetical protein
VFVATAATCIATILVYVSCQAEVFVAILAFVVESYLDVSALIAFDNRNRMS